VDDDGDVDVVVVNIDEAPSLLRNDVVGRPWVSLFLIGRESNRDAAGARVWLESGGRTQVKEVHASGSIFSSSDSRLHFGLGAATVVDEVRIRWPSGEQTERVNLAADRYHVVIEGVLTEN